VLLLTVVWLGRIAAVSLPPGLAALSVWQTGLGHGPWAHLGGSPLGPVLATQAYAATALTVPWLIASLMGERDLAQAELTDSYSRREGQVQTRTARLAEQTRRAQTAAAVSQALSEARLDEATAMQAVAGVVAGAFGDLGAVFKLADGGGLVVAAIHGDDEQLAEALRVVSAPLRFSPSTEGFAGRAMATGQVVRVGGGAERWADEAHPASREFFLRWGIHGFMVAPMRAYGGVVGAISVFRRETLGEFSDQDAQFMQELADLAALAMANASLHAQVAAQAAENARLLAAERVARLALRESEQNRREVLAGMLEAEEAERTRIATALHDDTVQVLAASLMALDRLPAATTAGDAERVTTQARATLAEATERTRRLMFELRPTVLHDYGVVAATRVLLDETARETAAATHLTGEVGRYHLVLEEAVYRGVQEALTNIRKHARATDISVAFEEHAGQLVCDVTDDGRGFDLEEVRSRPNAPLHMGLSHIGERVRAAGGDIDVASTPGRGTHIRMTVPVERRTSPDRSA
jgi:signal transduction histidine kinase